MASPSARRPYEWGHRFEAESAPNGLIGNRADPFPECRSMSGLGEQTELEHLTGHSGQHGPDRNSFPWMSCQGGQNPLLRGTDGRFQPQPNSRESHRRHLRLFLTASSGVWSGSARTLRTARREMVLAKRSGRTPRQPAGECWVMLSKFGGFSEERYGSFIEAWLHGAVPDPVCLEPLVTPRNALAAPRFFRTSGARHCRKSTP